MADKQGIKEITELLEGVSLLVGTYKAALADGKIDLQDLGVLVQLASDSKKIVDAVDGINKVGVELKDIDQTEAVALVGAIFALVKKVTA